MLCFLLVCYLSSVTCSELLSRHRRSWIIDSFTIEEEHPGPFPYVLGKIEIIRDYGVQFDLYGEGVDEEPKGVLSVDKESGAVIVHKAVDYEKKTVLKLKFEAKKTDSLIDTKLGVEISITDINDNPPRFDRDLYEVIVEEESVQGSSLVTVLAYDRDQKGTPNSTFHYELKSVTPNPPDTEFFINEFGTISFKGCLDHEVAEMFTIVVEAKDHGEVVSLSSSTTVVIYIQDSNNHLPIISGQTGPGKVKEDETRTSPLRLHVTDKDSPGSLAWRARYTIDGDEGEHFTIETDPDTNDGILTVVKPLDFEEGAQKELTISVDNDSPYFSCKVKEKTSSGLWKVETTRGDDPAAARAHSRKVVIEVEDANDSPVFSETVKDVILEENAPFGTWVEKVTAIDPDSSHARDFVYQVGNDPAGWVTVDPHTGDITTIKTLDRESPHVVNSVYTVLLHAVDDGDPPLTGTATLNIHIIDQNDNVPKLTVDYVDVCVSDSPQATNITAFDLDENPFGGPFTFELLGDVERKWKLNPSYGYTAGLVRQPGVFAGRYTIEMKISSLQGEFGVYNLNVTVCECSVTSNCRNRQHTATVAVSGALGIVFAATFLFLFLLLMAVVISSKKQFRGFQGSDSSGETLLKSNIEQPGTDCKIPDYLLAMSTNQRQYSISDLQSLSDRMQHGEVLTKNAEQNLMHKHWGDHSGQSISNVFRENWNQVGHTSTMNFHCKRHSNNQSEAALRNLLLKRLSVVKNIEGDLPDDEPHHFSDEDCDDYSELESITILDDDSFQKVLTDLSAKFNKLASICKPTHIQNV